MLRKFALLMIVLLPVRAQAQWPQFRGPLGNGHATAERLPTSWSEQKGIDWKVDVPGKGHSSPVIADGKIWLTTAITTPLTDAQKQEKLANVAEAKSLDLVGQLSLHILCFDVTSGKLLHDTEVFAVPNPEPIHHTNTYASPTPVLDGQNVFVHFGTYGSGCIDARTGEVKWRNNEFHVDHQNGPGSSPILWKNLMIFHLDGTDHQFIVGLNVKDGKLVWRTDRSGEMHPTPAMQKAYCTPTIIETSQGPELISPAANWVYAYNPENGSELWKAAYGELGFSTVPKPIVGHDMAYVCTSFMKSKLLAVRFGGKGDVTSSHIVWTSESQIPKKPSLLLVGQELYVLNDAGILTCLDALSGKEIWRERIGGNFAASPLFCQGLIYLFSEEGKTTVVRAGRTYEEVAVNELSEGCNASPAVVDNALILRTQSHLYRLGY